VHRDEQQLGTRSLGEEAAERGRAPSLREPVDAGGDARDRQRAWDSASPFAGARPGVMLRHLAAHDDADTLIDGCAPIGSVCTSW